MDSTNQPTPKDPTDDLQPQTPRPIIEPQQTSTVPTPPTTKQKKGIIILIAVILLLVVGSIAAWFVFGKKDKQAPVSQQTEASSQKSQTTADSGKCAYVPKRNYQENEGLYGTWRERAKNISFDVYLPCTMFKEFNVAELGISDENGGKVFLRFNRPEPETGEDNLPDNTWFYVQAQSTKNGCTTGCTKAGDTKFGEVLKNDRGDLYLTIGNSLIVWSSPPYDNSDDVKPMLDILNSLQKEDPTKLEFYNG